MEFLGICLPWDKVLKLKLEFLGISHYIVRDGSSFKCLEIEVGSTSIEIVTLKLVFLPLNFQESLVTFFSETYTQRESLHKTQNLCDL